MDELKKKMLALSAVVGGRVSVVRQSKKKFMAAHDLSPRQWVKLRKKLKRAARAAKKQQEADATER